MGKVKGQRIKLLYLMDIFKKYTDEDHPLNAEELIEKLEDNGIPVERKAIYRDISLLTEYGLDIVKTRLPKPGYYLGSRDFEVPEIYLLADAVQSADFISPKKSRELIKKLEGMLSENEAGDIRRRVYIDNRAKCENEEIFYNIDAATRAINSSKKIVFKYCRRSLKDGKIQHNEKQMKVSPYALVWADDHYYLVCNYEKYDNLMQLRLDRMKRVEVCGEAARNFSEVSEYKTHFDVADYAAKSFSMFGGETGSITVRATNDMLEQVIDRFGDKITIRQSNDSEFTFDAKALISEGLVNWIMQFGQRLTVIRPEKLKEAVKEKCEKIYSNYNK